MYNTDGKDIYQNAYELQKIDKNQKIQGGAIPFLVPLLSQIAMPIISKLIGGCCDDSIDVRFKKLEASGFFKDIGEMISRELSNIKQQGKSTVKKYGPQVIDELSRRFKTFSDETVDKVASKSKDFIDDGIKNLSKKANQKIEALGIKSAGKIDKRKSRGMLIKKIMKEQNMKLAEASKYIKANNLK
jgi:hypothetical protein